MESEKHRFREGELIMNKILLQFAMDGGRERTVEDALNIIGKIAGRLISLSAVLHLF